MVLIIAVVIVVIICIYFFITYNSLVKAKNLVKEAFSTMDVYLKKRWDLVPNLVEVVKSYAKYEKEIFEEVTSLRMNNYNDISTDKKIEVNETLTKDLSKIMAVSENYPELKSNQNFIELNKELSKTEDEIANSRKYYNGTVRLYNNEIQMFPSNIIAKICGFSEENMFEASTEEKENIKVEL